MGKSSKRKDPNIVFTATPPFPKQPWIYMSDPDDKSMHAEKVCQMIDAFAVNHITEDYFAGSNVTPVDSLLTNLDKYKDDHSVNKKAFLVVDKVNRPDYENSEKTAVAKKVREHAAKSGRTCVTINLFKHHGSKERDVKRWGANHLELAVADLTVGEVAHKVYQWLCKCLSSCRKRTLQLTLRHSHCDSCNRTHLSSDPGQIASPGQALSTRL
jgi:hypothetical protein